MTLVDGHLYSTFQPLLYQVAMAGLNPGDVAYPAGGFAGRYGANFRHGELATIDPVSRRIKLTIGLELGYDYLVIATGVSAAYHGIKGAAENTFALYTRTDALRLRDHLMTAFERLSVDSGDLHITVAGGGATGVEWRHARRAGRYRARRDLPGRRSGPGPRPAHRDGPLAAYHVQRETARLRAGPAGQARRGHQAEHPYRRDHRRQVLLADGENLPAA